MLKNSFSAVLIVVLLFGLATAQVPQKINYQGFLTDGEDNPVNGTLSIQFKIYDSATGGNMLWSETQSVLVTDGIYSVLLGSITPIPFSVFDGSVRYLGTTIGADAESIPRRVLVSVGYAFRSNSAKNLEGIYINETGNIGIGVTDPTEALDVEGNIKSSGKVLASAYSSTSPLIFEAPEGTERARIDDITGNFGIGTNNPIFNFHLYHRPPASDYMPPTKLGVQWQLPTIGDPVTDWFYFAVGGIGLLQGGTNMVRKSGSTLRFSTQDGILTGAINEQMRLTGSGNLGIGTGGPAHKLHVGNSTDTSGGVARFTNDQGTLLDIGVSGSNTGWAVGDDNPYIFTNNRDLVIFTGAGIVKTHGIFSDGADMIAGNGGGILVSGGGKIDLMDKNGNGPIISLDPKGKTSGTITTPILKITGGGDLAEPFDIAGSEAIKPGMVVAIDPENPGQLRIANKAYDRTVAGCVSGANGINPGLTMQQQGTIVDGSLLVALSGRVYCRADASYGAIQPGDLLTTSDTPGHAMKVTDYARAQGAILGKAMTAFEQGRGLVLLLVTLQ